MEKIYSFKFNKSFTFLAEFHWNRLNSKFKNQKYHPTTPIRRLETAITSLDNINKKTPVETNQLLFLNELKQNNYFLLKRIIICPPDQIEQLIYDVDSLLNRVGLSSFLNYEIEFGKILFEIFDYPTWQKGSKPYNVFKLINIDK